MNKIMFLICLCLCISMNSCCFLAGVGVKDKTSEKEDYFCKRVISVMDTINGTKEEDLYENNV